MQIPVRAMPPTREYRVVNATGDEVFVTSSLAFLNHYMDRHPECTSEEVIVDGPSSTATGGA